VRRRALSASGRVVEKHVGKVRAPASASLSVIAAPVRVRVARDEGSFLALCRVCGSAFKRVVSDSLPAPSAYAGAAENETARTIAPAASARRVNLVF